MNIQKVLRNFVRASINNSWKGSADPEDHAKIDEEFKLYKRLIYKLLKEFPSGVEIDRQGNISKGIVVLNEIKMSPNDLETLTRALKQGIGFSRLKAVEALNGVKFLNVASPKGVDIPSGAKCSKCDEDIGPQGACGCTGFFTPVGTFSREGPTCAEYRQALGDDQAKAMGIPLSKEILDHWKMRRAKEGKCICEEGDLVSCVYCLSKIGLFK